MSKTSVKERRTHRRYAAALTVQGTPGEGGIVACMVARNLSLGGLYCTSTRDFPEMTRLAVRLFLPSGQDSAADVDTLSAEAVVVRREELPADGGDPRYQFALFFTRLEETARALLASFLERQVR